MAEPLSWRNRKKIIHSKNKQVTQWRYRKAEKQVSFTSQTKTKISYDIVQMVLVFTPLLSRRGFLLAEFSELRDFQDFD
jgi:hypothetical protein